MIKIDERKEGKNRAIPSESPDAGRRYLVLIEAIQPALAMNKWNARRKCQTSRVDNGQLYEQATAG